MTTTNPTAELLHAVDAKHIRHYGQDSDDGPTHSWCEVCREDWPCDASRLTTALREAQRDGEARVRELREALWPFVRFNSSNETITITVMTAEVKRARAALREGEK